MSLDLSWDLYRTFYTVAKCDSFSRAADKLFVTQPTISYAIKQLETNLNTKLFYRTPNGAKLTSDGIELLDYVEKSFKAGNDFCSAGAWNVFPAGGVYEFYDPLAVDDHASDGVSGAEYKGYEAAEIAFCRFAGEFAYRSKQLSAGKIYNPE